MRNIKNIIVHDFKKLTASVVAMVILMGIVVVPCLFAWFNIFSNWDPFEPEATGNVPVAVYNADDGSEMLGLEINVGEKFIDAVSGNDQVGWIIADSEEDAVRGFYSGKYYASIVIPENFSEEIMSFSSGDLRHPKVRFYENEKINAVAPKIAEKIRKLLKEEIDATFVDTLGQYLTEAADAADAAGIDPEDTFRDLSGTMSDLSMDLQSSIVMVRAFEGLSDAASELLKASDNLIVHSQDTIDMSEQMLEEADGKLPEKADASSAENVIHDLTDLMMEDLTTITSDLSAVRDDMQKYNSFVDNDLEKHKELVEEMKESSDKIADKLNQLGLTGLASRFKRLAEKQQNIIDKLDRLETADKSNWSLIQGYLDEILEDVDQTAQSVQRIEADADDTLDKKLDQAVKDAGKAISDAQSALSGIYGDMNLLEDTLDKSEKSLKSLDKGLGGTVTTLISLQNGCRNLAELFDRFADSDMLDDVNHLMTNDAEVIAENMAAPIKMRTEQIYPVKNFGSIMAPFYTVIAQWVGAVFAAVMISMQVKRREDLEKTTLGERFFGRYRLFMIIGLMQGLLVSLGELLYLGIQCVHPLLFVLAACVNGIVFTMIIYSLVFALESIGLAACVIAMIIQVAGGGGTYPVEVLPHGFQVLYPFMPFHHAMNAMRECVGGMYGTIYIRSLIILLVFGLCAAAFGLLLHKPMKGIIEKVDESKRKSDVML